MIAEEANFNFVNRVYICPLNAMYCPLISFAMFSIVSHALYNVTRNSFQMTVRCVSVIDFTPRMSPDYIKYGFFPSTLRIKGGCSWIGRVESRTLDGKHVYHMSRSPRVSFLLIN